VAAVRGRFVVVGIVLAVALGAAGCGGGGSSTSVTPAPGALRKLLTHTVVAELKKEGVSPSAIECVEKNLDAMSERQIAGRIVEAAPAEQVESESEARRLGVLGKGCF
jgi:hypothetical protein